MGLHAELQLAAATAVVASPLRAVTDIGVKAALWGLVRAPRTGEGLAACGWGTRGSCGGGAETARPGPRVTSKRETCRGPRPAPSQAAVGETPVGHSRMAKAGSRTLWERLMLPVCFLGGLRAHGGKVGVWPLTGGCRGPKPSAHEVPARGWCWAPGGPQVPRSAPQGPHHRRELGQGRATGGSSGSSRDPRGLQRRSSRLGRRGARATGRAAGFPAPSVRAAPGSQRKDLG